MEIVPTLICIMPKLDRMRINEREAAPNRLVRVSRVSRVLSRRLPTRSIAMNVRFPAWLIGLIVIALLIVLPTLYFLPSVEKPQEPAAGFRTRRARGSRRYRQG